MKIAIASDHSGIEMKSALIKSLKDFDFIDCGPSDSTSVDYPDYAKKVAQQIKEKKTDLGILICGTGIGMSISANRFDFIRAGLCRTKEDAKLTREHNDTNILCLGARISTIENAIKISEVFLTTEYSNSPRHNKRISKLTS